MDLWIGAVNLGFLYAFMAIGTFITYKIYNFPDVTVEGSFTTGAAVVSVLLVHGMDPVFALMFSFLAGAAAGFFTGFIHTKFKINGLLAGIIVMTGLYSINLRIMDKSNIPLLNVPVFTSYISQINPGLASEVWLAVCLLCLLLIVWLLISLFFKTDLGITMRATGSNPVMVMANGVNDSAIKIFGIMLSNAFIGLSGGFIAQYQGFADIGMGVGSVVFSLAAVIIGEALIKHRSIYLKILSVIIGSIVFRFMVALALYIGLNPNDLKLITAVFVLITLITSGILTGKRKLSSPSLTAAWLSGKKRRGYVVAAVLLLAVLIPSGYFLFGSKDVRITRIGIIMPNDSDILVKTREGFYQKMKELGYEEGYNCEFIEMNANGDIPTINTIVDNLINKQVDIFLTISSASTQVAINKIRNKPVVFATVAEPFKLGAGKTAEDHLPNVTGTYGTMPVAGLVKIMRSIYPGPLNVGTMYNPTFVNSVHNLQVLQNVLKEYKDISLNTVTVNGSGDVYQAALSLTAKKPDAIFLVPDITVYSAFESVLKAASAAHIPVFTGDVERLQDGVLAVDGYEYVVSGIQTAVIVDRIIKGEKPSAIPFEKYKSELIGVNYDAAKKLGVSIPDDVKKMVNAEVENSVLKRKNTGKSAAKKKVRLAFVQFSENVLNEEVAKGALEEIAQSGLKNEYELSIQRYNAHADFGTQQSISQDVVSKNFDYVFTITTPSLQSMANSNKKIPHVFCAVTDPVASGVAASFAQHQSNLTGLATPQPVETTVKMMRRLFPGAKSIGIIWNSSEKNSEICTKMARAAAKKYNFKLIERTVSSTNDVDDALNSLINEKIDIFLASGDITVQVAIPLISPKLLKRNIPFFTNNPADVFSGSFISLGANYYQVGVNGAKLLERVIRGTDVSKTAIEKYVPEQYNINLKMAAQMNVRLPEDIIKGAARTVK